ncbi:acyl carrier protein [Zooshikella marina]|uniref:Acyl carrier protein n=1 Tax=Zooshikella ganghwensis TaxID=202772 RepID=A0A4P9VRK8_9GAMM|nr:phosphopantetheine-binding protein [Zooshikella ganghwensis]MBU2707252.1 acyl carrier protein [Zooshikella ganghwensis]RDH45686.1 acyl carrier protein [Zooshikella ganghwensis]
MNPLREELKQLIISTLELEDISSSDINSDDPLFTNGLGLDSIDALELGLALKKKYQIKLEANNEQNKKFFYSVNTLAEFIQAQRSV